MLAAAWRDRDPFLPLLPLLVAALLLALLAADSFALLLGLGLIAMLAWALASGPLHLQPGTRLLGLALLVGACLLPAFGLMVPQSGSLAFAALRAAPPSGWRAVAILVLSVPAAVAQAGLGPACLPQASPPIAALDEPLGFSVGLWCVGAGAFVGHAIAVQRVGEQFAFVG